MACGKLKHDRADLGGASHHKVTGPNAVLAENQLPGDDDWRIQWYAGPHALEGYASQVSVNHGDTIDFHVSTDGPHGVGWALYRMGYYQGHGARKIQTGSFQATAQPLPAVDAATGRVECTWPVTFSIATDPTWTSGVYLVKLTRDDGPEQYLEFVVRADERQGVAVFQQSVTTYEAYNQWGGESLYTSAISMPGGHATEVSFNRPFMDEAGAGEFLKFEYDFVLWAESRGYDLTYLTNVDVDRDPSLLQGQLLFMSVGHDEYWSRGEREAVQAALDGGTSLAVFSGNSAYWQIRLEPSRVSGAERRTIVCYKDYPPGADPHSPNPDTTVMWREDPVNQPEDELLGVMFDAWQLADAPWVVTNSSHWLYNGTGVKDGDSIPLIVGYESDHVWNDGHTPSGVEVVAHSPVMDHVGHGTWHESATYTVDSGAFVFAAGTIEWSWGLAAPGLADARLQRMTANVLEHAGLDAPLPGDDFHAGSAPSADLSEASGQVWTFAGAAGQDGFQDGPASEARFNRPLGVAVDTDGTIYVADTGNHAIRRIANDADHTVTTIVGNGQAGTTVGPGAQAQLSLPNAVVIGADGALYVVDTGNERIVKIARDGQWTTSVFAGSPTGEAGKVDAQGTSARFAEPVGIAVNGSDLYVTDTTNAAIRKIDHNGNVTTIAGGTDGYRDGDGTTALFYRPAGIAAADGALWVVDSGNRAIRKVALDGAHATTTIAGSGQGGFADGPATQALLMPWYGIAEKGGTVYVTDTGNGRLRAIEGGNVRTLAGTGHAASTDGPAAQADFMLPTDVKPLANGQLLIVDEGASVLRILDRGPGGGSTGASSSTAGSSSTQGGTSGGSGTSGTGVAGGTSGTSGTSSSGTSGTSGTSSSGTSGTSGTSGLPH